MCFLPMKSSSLMERLTDRGNLRRRHPEAVVKEEPADSESSGNEGE